MSDTLDKGMFGSPGYSIEHRRRLFKISRFLDFFYLLLFSRSISFSWKMLRKARFITSVVNHTVSRFLLIWRGAIFFRANSERRGKHRLTSFKIHCGLYDFTIPFRKKNGRARGALTPAWVVGLGCWTQFHSFQEVDNWTHSRTKSDTSAGPLRVLQRLKQLRVLHGCIWSTIVRHIFYKWIF